VSRPVILLVGGATGTGKSTVASEVGHRLGITRVFSTDVVRQTLRAFFAREEMPSIHRSSFDPPPGEELLEFFRAQTRQVLVAVQGTIERAVEEERWTVLEGVHLVPGMLDLAHLDAVVVHCVLAIDDEEAHAAHFWIRDATSNGLRPVARYLERLQEIRRLQDYVLERAMETGVPVIRNAKVEQSVEAVIDLVLGAAAEQLEAV
jgi:2-phosphoglycerate kinase